ncbi:hypothetical protein BDV23DRAFT_193211 [Aspergillus alliaceus]|uniref:Uncharacterized protein n=1 Tax=Petromyces alliaceus TaxID=209559 RepID=A0A5N7CBF7_PETAA|nr:hypothetical protein BDV23DRAFT_193211 [Aspergillus alliaceus]
MLSKLKINAQIKPPQCISVPEPPFPSTNKLQLKVLAVSVTQVVRPLSYGPKVDRIGADETTGDLYYITELTTRLFAERTNVDKRQIFKLEPRVDSVAVAAPDNPVARSWMALQRRIIGDYWGRTVLAYHRGYEFGRWDSGNRRSLAERCSFIELDDHVVLREPYALPPGVGPVHMILDCVSNGTAASGIPQTAQGVYGEKLQPIGFLGSNAGCFAVQDWKTQMPEVLHLISMLEAPFEVFIAPLSEVASVWESEAALIKRLVVIPGL